MNNTAKKIKDDFTDNINLLINTSLENNNVAILPPMDVYNSANLLKKLGYKASLTMIDPWYNKGVGGVREDYVEYIVGILDSAKNLKEKLAQRKLRYMPGPTSVIEAALRIGFVGKKEQTGHPAQKPVEVYEKLLMMVTKGGDLVIDPMAGSGTTGVVAKNFGLKAIMCDESEEYIGIMEKRLNIKRLPIHEEIQFILKL